MTAADDLDALVKKQLAKLDLTADRPPDAASWRKFLQRVSSHYQHIHDDRRLLTRSLELSSSEMTHLQHQIIEERDRLRRLVSAISEGLSGFREVIDQMPESSDASEVTRSIGHAKTQLSQRLTELFDDGGAASWSSEEAHAVRSEFMHLSEQLLSLLRATAHRAVLHNELEVARTVQHLLVPSADVIHRDAIHLVGYFRPAAQCGGDWWSTHDMADAKVLVIIGDVTGHGVAPAIITGAAKASCDVARLMTSHRIGAADLLTMMNRSICEAARQQLFMTCAASIFDPETRTLTLANAGHNFPYLIRAGGRGGEIHPLVSVGNPLGAAAESRYENARVDLHDGDVIVWYTDGLTECENGAAEQFGERRLRQALLRAATEPRPEQIRDRVVDEVRAFFGDVVPLDDITMVVARVGA